jgi:PhnB protein
MGVVADTPTSEYIPAGWPAVIPRLSVSEPQACVQFLKAVFDALGEYNESRPSEMRIGDSLIMIGDILNREVTNAFLYVYVSDADLVFAKALAQGAICLELPAELPYGDRRAMVEDPWGNRWQIATHRQFAAKV